jgi:hypothetical protein
MDRGIARARDVPCAGSAGTGKGGRSCSLTREEARRQLEVRVRFKKVNFLIHNA